MTSPRILALTIAAAIALTCAANAQEDPSAAKEQALRDRVEAVEGKEKAAANAELGRFLEGESRWSEAASAWRQARRLRGDVSDLEGELRALCAFAEDVVAQGETGTAVAAAFEDARTALRRAREAGSKSIDVSLGLARCAEMSGDTESQLAELRAATAAAKDDLRPARALATALAASGKAAEALDLYAKLSADHTDDADLALEYFGAATAAGDEKQQMTAVTRSLAAAPENVRAWSALWRVFAGKQRWGELADAAVAVAKAQPKSVFAAHYAGLACSRARRFDEALQWLETAWTRQPSDSAVRLEAARILWTEKHDRAGSEKLYAFVIANEPANQDAADGLFWIGKRLSDEGDRAGAVHLFEAVAKARPQDPVAQGNFGNSLRFAGRYDDSEKVYLAAIATFPADAQLRNDYALLLDVEGRSDDARKALLAGHEADPSNNDSMENLGFLARARGDRDEALKWFRLAHAALVAKGDNDHKHRINVDDQRWPLPPLR